MKQLFVFAILVACLHASSADSSELLSDEDYFEVDTFSNTYNFNDTCTSAGLMCESCKELVQCIETSPGQFTIIHIQSCGADLTCLNKQCSNETNPRCTNQTNPNFYCTHTGMYPDPYDCKRYHICAQKEDTVDSKDRSEVELKCLDNFGYDPASTYCKTVLPGGNCPVAPPIPPCINPGDNGAVTGTSIYYICSYEGKILVPHLYMCPHGKRYASGKCA